MLHAIVERWDKDLALRFPIEIASHLRLRDGDRLEIETGLDRIVLRRAKLRYTLEDLFGGKTQAEWRAIYADAYDWGSNFGREIIDE